MLTESEITKIEHELQQYERKESAAIEALKVIQDSRGWVSDESLYDLAAFLEMTPEELDSVATFYNLVFRKPVGDHIILVCDSISCWLMDGETIQQHLKDRLNIDFGQTTADNRFTLLPIPCLGTCDHAPAMMIDDQLHRDLDPDKTNALLDELVNG